MPAARRIGLGKARPPASTERDGMGGMIGRRR
jgi:hypothetical protein